MSEKENPIFRAKINLYSTVVRILRTRRMVGWTTGSLNHKDLGGTTWRQRAYKGSVLSDIHVEEDKKQRSMRTPEIGKLCCSCRCHSTCQTNLCECVKAHRTCRYCECHRDCAIQPDCGSRMGGSMLCQETNKGLEATSSLPSIDSTIDIHLS